MSNFRIYNSTLCPDLWDEYLHLDPEVRINLLRMAYDFYRKSKLPASIIDIYLMGSIVNYNWTPDSDADIHVIIDYSKLKMPEETAFKTVKMLSTTWNLEHQITVKNHKVEINLQNSKEVKPHVTGIYSLVKDQWVRKPSHQNIQVDKVSIQTKYSGMKKYIESVINSGDRETIKKVKDYIDAFRQYGLDTRGELSIENIVFKILRSKGLIKSLKDAITKTYDREMTVTETYIVPKESDCDYIGGIIQGEVRAEKIPMGKGRYYMHNEFPGLFSGQNNTNWRYLKDPNLILWNQQPEEESKTKVDDFLLKRGIISPIHKNMYTYEESIITENTKSKYFTLKFGDPGVSKGVGVIYLGDIWFANIYKDIFSLGNNLGKWVFNKAGGSLEMKHPGYSIWFDKPEDVLPMLDDWYEKNKSIKESEFYYSKMSDDEEDNLSNTYFSVGQEDDENISNSYCWIWDKVNQSIKAVKGGTHSMNFGYTRKDYTFSGWYDPEKNAISFVFPDSELRKLGMKKPTVDDIPQLVYKKLIDKFGNKNPRFEVFEGYGAGVPEQDRLHIPGHRWQIKSKDAPKTPKMIDRDLDELIQNVVNETIQKLSDIKK